MDDLQAISKLIDVGGNVALLISVYFINQSAKANARVAERLARIEAHLHIEPDDTYKE
jgi:hypothetical protein